MFESTTSTHETPSQQILNIAQAIGALAEGAKWNSEVSKEMRKLCSVLSKLTRDYYEKSW